MTGDGFEAVGQIVEGGLVARAVEKEAGEGAVLTGDAHSQESDCLNCGTTLAGAHCHACGQKAHVNRTLRAFFHDLMHGVLHFEGKFWRTLPLLVWRPGQLTREYIDGRRARYISPIALFLFTVFVSFALFSLSGGFGEIDPEIDAASREQLTVNLAEAEDEIAALQSQIVAAREAGEPVGELEVDLVARIQTRDLMQKLLDGDTSEDSILKVTSTPNADSSEDAANGASPDAAETDQASNGFADWLEATWGKAKANPGLLLYKLQTNAYKLSWLLIPLSLPVMWLLFPFSRKFRMYDHTIFVTYSISFMTMLAVIMSVGLAYEWGALAALPTLYAPFHLYRSLRGTYGLSRFGAIWRMLILSIGIWITLSAFALIMIGIVISG